jgi:hypothetical protein
MRIDVYGKLVYPLPPPEVDRTIVFLRRGQNNPNANIIPVALSKTVNCRFCRLPAPSIARRAIPEPRLKNVSEYHQADDPQ